MEKYKISLKTTITVIAIIKRTSCICLTAAVQKVNPEAVRSLKKFRPCSCSGCGTDAEQTDSSSSRHYPLQGMSAWNTAAESRVPSDFNTKFLTFLDFVLLFLIKFQLIWVQHCLWSWFKFIWVLKSKKLDAEIAFWSFDHLLLRHLDELRSTLFKNLPLTLHATFLKNSLWILVN